MAKIQKGSTPQPGDKPRSSSRRPQSHCGAFQRRTCADEDEYADVPDCSHAGAAARESVGSCRLCLKLRLRLENAERARMKAQEQLAQQQVENLRLRGVVTQPDQASDQPELATENESAESRAVGCPVDGSAANLLESYRREVELLQARLRERDDREAKLMDKHRQQSRDHESARQEWETQVAGLVCEVQDLQSLVDAKDTMDVRVRRAVGALA